MSVTGLAKRQHPAPFRFYDLKKIYYYLHFSKIPRKDLFFYQPHYRLVSVFRDLVFYVYGGRFWFKVRVLRWNTGLSVRFFI